MNARSDRLFLGADGGRVPGDDGAWKQKRHRICSASILRAASSAATSIAVA
jgi:hypothetical protein